MIDPYHLEAYGTTTVNYNRDVEVFPVLNAMFERIYGESPYKSPTDMGVNMAGFCISDEEICIKASRDEIIRRYFAALMQKRNGTGTDEAISKIELLMKKAGVSPDDRAVVAAALSKSAETENQPAVAIMLPSGKTVTGKTTKLLGASSAALLNAVKAVSGIDSEIDLIKPEVIAPIQALKTGFLGNKNPRLHSDEVAGLFRDVLNEPEFKNRFKKIVFAIYEGKPSSRRRDPIGRDGKYAPFYEIFGK